MKSSRCLVEAKKRFEEARLTKYIKAVNIPQKNDDIEMKRFKLRRTWKDEGRLKWKANFLVETENISKIRKETPQIQQNLSLKKHRTQNLRRIKIGGSRKMLFKDVIRLNLTKMKSRPMTIAKNKKFKRHHSTARFEKYRFRENYSKRFKRNPYRLFNQDFLDENSINEEFEV